MTDDSDMPNYIPDFEHLCKSIPKLSLLLLTVQPVTSQVDIFQLLKGSYILYMTEYQFEFNVLRKNSFNLSQKKCSINDTLGFGYSACDVTVSYPRICLGRSVGFVYSEGSLIVLNSYSMISTHTQHTVP